MWYAHSSLSTQAFCDLWLFVRLCWTYLVYMSVFNGRWTADVWFQFWYCGSKKKDIYSNVNTTCDISILFKNVVKPDYLLMCSDTI